MRVCACVHSNIYEVTVAACALFIGHLSKETYCSLLLLLIDLLQMPLSKGEEEELGLWGNDIRAPRPLVSPSIPHSMHVRPSTAQLIPPSFFCLLELSLIFSLLSFFFFSCTVSHVIFLSLQHTSCLLSSTVSASLMSLLSVDSTLTFLLLFEFCFL